MKLNKFAFTLAAAALLPAFAYANTDAVATSFERDLTREPVKFTAIAGEPDALTIEFNAALNGKADPVLASFERDMYRTPANTATMIAGEPDALTVEFNTALNSKADPVLASFERDMNREPAA